MIQQAGSSSEAQAALIGAIQQSIEMQGRPKIGTLSNGKQIRIESA